MRVLVCGGREFSDGVLLNRILDKVHAKYGNKLVIIHGAAPGADTLAETWAKSREVPYCGVPARWAQMGRAAGPHRNKTMRDKLAPEACIAFPGGRGTAVMVDLMREVGIEPWVVGAAE